MITDADVADLRAALMTGGVAVVPTDTVYGVAAALESDTGVERLYALKGRPRTQPCQVLCYAMASVERALAAVPQVAAIVRELLPGTVTCIVPDPDLRFAAASGDAAGSVGLRVPATGDAALAALDVFLVATSANDPGGVDPARVDDVPRHIRAGVDVILDAGVLPGTASTVVDLRRAARGEATLIRPGPDAAAVLATLEAAGVRRVG